MKSSVEDSQFMDVAIVKDAFTIEENIKVFMNAPVFGPRGLVGELLGPYAKMGKCKVLFRSGLRNEDIGQSIKILIGLK